MLIVNRYYREKGTLSHSTEYFENAELVNGRIPEDVNINLLKKVAADAQRDDVDYAMCQIIGPDGTVYKTEVGKRFPGVKAD